MKLNKLLLTLTMLSTLTMLGASACPVKGAGDCPPPPPKFEKKFAPHKGPHHFAHKKKCNLIKELNLTEEQKAILKQNREESKKKMKPIMKKMSKKKYEIDKVMLSNASKLEKIEKIEKIKAEMKEFIVATDMYGLEEEGLHPGSKGVTLPFFHEPRAEEFGINYSINSAVSVATFAQNHAEKL